MDGWKNGKKGGRKEGREEGRGVRKGEKLMRHPNYLLAYLTTCLPITTYLPTISPS
jgi:hypothetical protein